MDPATDEQIHQTLVRLNKTRVQRVQQVANLGAPDGISGPLLLAVCARETWGRNIEGGARLVNGVWVAEDRFDFQDVGAFQISRHYHFDALARMPGVKTGTWGPTVRNADAAMSGYVPRFADGLAFTLAELHESIAFAEDHEVPERDRPAFSIAAHNRGQEGALQGYEDGNVDKLTAGGDYSAWCLAARTKINHWLGLHPGWRV